MKITIEISDELVALARTYAPELTMADAQSTAIGAVNSMVINKVTSKIKEDGDAQTQSLLDEEMANIINIIE